VPMLRIVGTLPGCVPVYAAGRNGPGLGRLRYDADGLAWRAPGSGLFGTPVPIADDGTCVLYDGADGDKYVRLAVHADYLGPPGERQVLLSDLYHSDVGGKDVSALNASAGTGVIEFLDLEVIAGVVDVENVRIWLDPAADPRVDLSLDQAIWSAPTVEGDGLYVARIAAGDSIGLSVRRTIAPGTTSTPKQLVHVFVAFDEPV
jgi:hypothetical protein